MSIETSAGEKTKSEHSAGESSSPANDIFSDPFFDSHEEAADIFIPKWAKEMSQKMKDESRHQPSASSRDEFAGASRAAPPSFEDYVWGSEASTSSKEFAGKTQTDSSKYSSGAHSRPFDPSTDAEGLEEDEAEVGEETWEDAVDHEASDERFTVGEKEEQLLSKKELTADEMKDLLEQATRLKTLGNELFTRSSDPDSEGALSAYKTALQHLPETSSSRARQDAEKEARDELPKKKDTAAKPDTEANSAVVEISEEEAAAIEAEQKRMKEEEERKNTPGFKERLAIEEEVEDLRKILWSNLGAVYVKKNDDREAVKACSEALKIDPEYVKALHRRALADERIGSWSSLTQAQEDYNLLLRLLPSTSPLLRQIRSSMTTLPKRLAAQQEKEKDEMMGKLKELGNGILGRFGLSTDNFKFDPQPGGGYSMRFER